MGACIRPAVTEIENDLQTCANIKGEVQNQGKAGTYYKKMSKQTTLHLFLCYLNTFLTRHSKGKVNQETKGQFNIFDKRVLKASVCRLSCIQHTLK